jgi:putative ABC transport system permease protein
MSDLKQTLRFIRTHPGFAFLVVLCLGLGIGVNSAIFSVVDRILFRPLPYKDPERIFMLFEFHGDEKADSSYQNFLAWREASRTFESIEARGELFYNLTGVETPERLACGVVSPGLFDLLGAKAVAGRTSFRPEETRPGAAPLVVLGYPLWQRRFGGDPAVVGRAILLNGKSHTVVGVLPPGFYFFRDTDLWVPMALDPAHPPFPPQVKYLFATARLKPGVTPERAQAEMHTIAKRLALEHPDTNAGWDVRLIPLREELFGDLKGQLTALLALVGLVLLIACANVGNLLLSRAATQRGEMALRSALGASRLRIGRQLLTESMILALLGGALGLALSAVAVRLLPRISNAVGALLHDGVTVDVRVLGFTLGISLLTGLLPGLLVAASGARPNFGSDLKSTGRRSTEGARGRWLQNALVVAEVALALVLLVAAGLMIKSFERLSRTSPGFDPGNVLTAQISLPDWKYREPDQMRAFWRELLPRLAALPGVTAVGTTHVIPVNDDTFMTSFEVEGRVPASADEELSASFRKVSPDFFRALRIPLLAGRSFTDQDDEHRPRVAIVSQEMARRFWPGADPLGKRIRRLNKPWLTVVGVAGDVQETIPGTPIGSTFYVPYVQDPKSAVPTTYLLVRTAGHPQPYAAAVRRTVAAVDRDQPIDRVMTMEQRVANSLAKRRFSTLMLGLFATLGVVLAMIGIYGVLSYAVSLRNHEIGVRMALGAHAGDVVQLILRQGMKLTGIGLAIGLALALAVSRLFASLLYEVKWTDPTTFLGITLALAAIACLASYLPSRRATRVDPILTLRQE